MRWFLALLCAVAGCRDKKTPALGSPPEVAEPAPRPPPSDPDPSLGPVSTELKPVPAAIARVVALEKVAGGFTRPLALEFAPGDDSGRLFVVEEGGLIKILRGGEVAAAPFLDLRGEVGRRHEEQGLLGLAFHPDFATNRRLFVNYTNRDGATRVVEYRVDPANPDRVDPDTAKVWLRIAQPYANHNGGGLEFGPDGKLYVGTGDGGSAGDPRGNAQNRRSLLGKMLRIDVDGAPGAGPVIVQLGLRNPWRFNFDRETGDLYIGDVGQDKWEYVNVAPARAIDGVNWGWNITEGSHCFRRRLCDPSRFAAPAIEYDHETGCSITGGEVYRGAAIPEIKGRYFYADYCTAIIRSFRWAADGVRDHWDWKPVLDPRSRLATLSSFGSDRDGELYLISLDGPIYKIVRRPGR